MFTSSFNSALSPWLIATEVGESGAPPAKNDYNITAGQAFGHRHRDAKYRARILQAECVVYLCQATGLHETRALRGKGILQQDYYIFARPILLAAARTERQAEKCEPPPCLLGAIFDYI